MEELCNSFFMSIIGREYDDYHCALKDKHDIVYGGYDERMDEIL